MGAGGVRKSGDESSPIGVRGKASVRGLRIAAPEPFEKWYDWGPDAACARMEAPSGRRVVIEDRGAEVAEGGGI